MPQFIIIALTVLIFGFKVSNDTPSDFDTRLSTIASSFKQNIMDKDECEKQQIAAGDLADEIKKAINDDETDAEDIPKLKDLQKEAEAVEDYIRCVGDCSEDNISIKDMNLANGRIRGNISIVSTGKFCSDFISVTIGNYVVYLAENTTDANFTIKYNYKSAAANGNGEMGLMNKSARPIYDNREHPEQKTISVYAVSCKTF